MLPSLLYVAGNVLVYAIGLRVAAGIGFTRRTRSTCLGVVTIIGAVFATSAGPTFLDAGLAGGVDAAHAIGIEFAIGSGLFSVWIACLIGGGGGR